MLNLQVDSTIFLDNVFEHLKKNNVDIKNWEVDHLCYRTSSPENYIETKKYFSEFSECLIESEVNGRLIATYKLSDPIHYGSRIIDLVEVPAPKPGKETKEGLEHIEIVIDEPFEEIIELYPHLKFNVKGMKKTLNPELQIEFPDCCVKLHHKSLESIINIEKNQNIIEFFNETEILTKFKSFSPCLSGTLPLGIQTKDSDLDILFNARDLDLFERTAIEHLHNYRNFSHKRVTHQNIESLVINFHFDQLPVELFCQSLCVFKQQANQHFLIEARLLKVFGSTLKDRVITLKEEGYKTEPAFGKVLNLSNPYEDLIVMNKLSDSEIFDKYRSVI